MFSRNVASQLWLPVAAIMMAACSEPSLSPPVMEIEESVQAGREYDIKAPSAAADASASDNMISYSVVSSGLVTEPLSQSLTAAELAQDIVGAGVTVQNATFVGSPVAAGRFSGGSGILGLADGVVMGSGAISNVIGPNAFDGATTLLNVAGDAQLSTLAGAATYDASVLTFDFVPPGSRIAIQYVFGSDEYNEYVNSPFNDAFALFVNGSNCALTPSNQVISVNSINNGNPFGTTPNSHPTLFVNNERQNGTAPHDTELDGFTTVLTCNALVNPGVANQMKVVIADVSDDTRDSHVFLRPAPNQAPQFVAPTPAEASQLVVTVGQPLSFTIAADDADASDLMTLNAVSLPGGAVFTPPAPSNPVSGTVTWTPTPAQAGTHIVSFVATDEFGAAATRSLSIFVNQPPAFNAPTPADQHVFTVRSGHNVTFAIAASDPDAGQPVTLTHGGLPGAATIADAGPADPLNATFSWTPADADAGLHSFTYQVTDPHGAASETRTVNINVVGVLSITVVDNNNAPIANQVVTAVNSTRGPRRDDGTRTLAVTDPSGAALIGGLEIDGNGYYCVHTRPIRSIADATLGESDLVPPETGYTPQVPSDFAPAVTGPDNGPYENSQPLTRQTFLTNCVQAPVIHLTTSNGNATVKLTVQSAAKFKVKWQDMNGNALNVPGWTVIDMEGVLPWFPAALNGTGVKGGLLITGMPADGNGFVTLGGLPPNEPAAIESAIIDVPDQGFLTFTIKTTTPGANQQVDLGTQTLEPLLCTLNRTLEPTGDGSKIDFVGLIKDGFRATYGVPLQRRDEIGIFYHQRGTGDAKLHMRVFVGGEALNLLTEYRWDGTTGTVTKRSGDAFAAGITAEAFFAPQPDGTVRVSWTVASLPANHAGAAYSLQTAGDRFPDGGKGTTGFQQITVPGVCTGGQGNDDQWWVGA